MDSLKENFHHANLVISNEDILDDIFSFVESLNISTVGNQNFIFEKLDKFLVGDARRIFEMHLSKTPGGELQIFVLYFNFITTEAQNALLKMFEEPKERTHFFIISPSKSIFLETILSRVNLIETKPKSKSPKSIEFLNMNIGERIKFIASLIKDIKDEKALKQEVIDLLSGIEVELEKNKKYKELKSVINARKYINLNGASVKMLLENVALSV